MKKKLDPESYKAAMEHAYADKRMGRKWECACGACKLTRKAGIGFNTGKATGPEAAPPRGIGL